jgi:hypothetical protein
MVIRTLGSPAMSKRLFGYVFLTYWWVLLPMVTGYFNGYACARTLDIAAQIKIIRESSLVFLSLYFNCLWLPSEIYKIVS